MRHDSPKASPRRCAGRTDCSVRVASAVIVSLYQTGNRARKRTSPRVRGPKSLAA